MKILILGLAKLKYMPYLHFYLDHLNSQANELHLLYWNRDLQPEDTQALTGVTLHEFRRYQEDDVPPLTKLGSLIAYRRFAKQTLQAEAFDFLILLHSLPGILIFDVLRQQYRDNYVFDYRDSTYESFPPFRWMIHWLSRHAYATFTSSDAFRSFLPGGKGHPVYTSHNILLDSLSHRDPQHPRHQPPKQIRLAFWGFIRHEEINLALIDKIGADPRFSLHYYGREQQVAQRLKRYVQQHQIGNVFFHGEYRPEDRYAFAQQTDLLHNLYQDKNTMLAMGNKYYDGAIFYLPQLCMKGSFMAQQAAEHGIGLACDPRDEDFTQQVYQYYIHLSWPQFIANCDQEVQRVLAEYRQGCRQIEGINDERNTSAKPT